MALMFLHLFCLAALQVLVTLVGSSPVAERAANTAPQVIHLRIEGATQTVFEGTIKTLGHNVTTASGGTHHCDGTNNGENASPGATPTSALDDASRLAGFTFDGPFTPEFDDFLITRIGSDIQSHTQFWTLLVNFTFTDVGGCQQEVTGTDDVLWAFGDFTETFLKLSGPAVAHKNQPITVTVTNGATGKPVRGASVGGTTTGADGTATLTFTDVGAQQLKAEDRASIRSNALVVFVHA